MRNVSVNLVTTTFQITLVVLLTRATSYLEGLKLYFQFSDLFFGADNNVSVGAVLTKLAVPVAAGFVVAYCQLFFWSRKKRKNNADEHSREKEELLISIRAGGFFAAFLLSWPMIVQWDVLASDEYTGYYEAFLFIYLLYAVSYFLLSGVGASVAWRLRDKPEAVDKGGIKAKSILLETVLSTFASGVATFVLSGLLPS